MDKKKLIAASLGGVVLIGAGAYMYLQSGQDIGTTQTNGTGQASSELGTGSGYDESGESGKMNESGKMGLIEEEEEITGEELEALFEGVYTESVRGLRNYLNISRSLLMKSEFDKIEDLCPIGKKLPSDYKDQYREWRKNYKFGDMSLIFTDEEGKQYYVKDAAYTYTNIYDNAKIECLPASEMVMVTGIGYDQAEGWLRVETSTGVGYIEADKLVEKKGDGFIKFSKTMYAIEAVNIRVLPSEDADKVGSLSVGESVHVIGIGQMDVSGWSKVEVDGQEYYVRSEYLSDEKPVTSNNNSGSNQSSSQGSGNQGGGNSDSGNTGGSGGDSGGNTGGSGEDVYDPDMYTPPQLSEEDQQKIDEAIEESKDEYGQNGD